VTHWECQEIFQLAFSSFHLTMNLLWCILETHRGTLNHTGSLTHLFAVLEKTWLGGEHPDYHTLLSALWQILNRLILNVWHTECGCTSLSEFAKTNPKPQDFLIVLIVSLKNMLFLYPPLSLVQPTPRCLL
jgi:hypothetical protein